MTEKDILNRQEQNGNKEFYLLLIGKFLHAYGNGAFALARAAGYRVMRKQRKNGEILTCGFPVERLETVRQRVESAGGQLDSLEENIWAFRGIEGTPDLGMVNDSQTKPAPPEEKQAPAATSWLEEAIRNFNLSMSTPLDAMLFIGSLQQQLKELEHNNDDACESSVG